MSRTRDANGLRCEIQTLASDGRTLIPSGGTAFGYINPGGQWLERSELVAVDQRGARLNPVSSSFDVPLELENRTTPERFLDHSIRLSYALGAVDAVPTALARELDEGAIFKVDFSYRGGIGADPAFVMQGQDGTLWLLVGDEGDINFVGFAQAAGMAEGDSDAAADDLDFEMM